MAWIHAERTTQNTKEVPNQKMKFVRWLTFSHESSPWSTIVPAKSNSCSSQSRRSRLFRILWLLWRLQRILQPTNNRYGAIGRQYQYSTSNVSEEYSTQFGWFVLLCSSVGLCLPSNAIDLSRLQYYTTVLSSFRTHTSKHACVLYRAPKSQRGNNQCANRKCTCTYT